MSDKMDIDEQSSTIPAPPQNAMAALMAGAKGKAKAEASSQLLTEKEKKEADLREGLPWCANPPGRKRASLHAG